MKIFLRGINVDVINEYCKLRLCDDQCKLTKNFIEREESSLKREGFL